jgi:Protein of unknown function (DUF2721)
MTTTLSQLVPVLQFSIGPVILISGVGLLLLTLTNRFGRMVDRTRQLNHELAAGPTSDKAAPIRTQIDILMRRASILRLSITLGAITVLLDAVLMLLLFLSAWMQLELAGLIAAVFCLALVSLIGAMISFIKDMNLALAAVRHEVKT